MLDPAVFTVSKADPAGKEPTAGAVLNITADLSRVREIRRYDRVGAVS